MKYDKLSVNMLFLCDFKCTPSQLETLRKTGYFAGKKHFHNKDTRRTQALKYINSTAKLIVSSIHTVSGPARFNERERQKWWESIYFLLKQSNIHSIIKYLTKNRFFVPHCCFAINWHRRHYLLYKTTKQCCCKYISGYYLHQNTHREPENREHPFNFGLRDKWMWHDCFLTCILPSSFLQFSDRLCGKEPNKTVFQKLLKL